ncbi:MAG: hypothetical protein ACFCU5_07240 [Pleurocapsa sp.]
MLKINKNLVLDENQQPIAVQISIAEFEQIEEILENFGLNKLICSQRITESCVKPSTLEGTKT